jgi:ribonuclease P protein component
VGAGGLVAAPEEGSEAADDPGADKARRTLTASGRLGRASRLVRADQLRRVAEAGRRRRQRLVDIMWMVGEAGHPRLGLIVPRFQSTAVARNRLRRRLREIWRRRVAPELGAVDMVVRARREAYEASFAELSADLVGWAQRRG